jgi:lactoylglutathione lyase
LADATVLEAVSERIRGSSPLPSTSAVFLATKRPEKVALVGPATKLWSMAVKKLLHTRMRVDDLERTVKFYADALGLQVARRHTSPRGAQLVFLRTPNSDEEIEICQLPGSPSVQVQPDLMHLAFEVDDLAAFAAELQRKGFALSDGPTKSGGGQIAFIDAPEGYEVELIQRGK